MNVYDFDGTIYDGDSTLDFYKHCLKNFPKTWLAMPNAILGAVLYMFAVINKTEFKGRFFSFLKYVEDADAAVGLYWEKHEKKIKPWYLRQKRETDIIVSASPEFLLKPVCDRLGIRVEASRVDRRTGAFTGENCWGEEKVRRLADNLAHAGAFYSDSLSDGPLAGKIAKSYIVKGDSVIPWSEYKPSMLAKTKQTFFTPDFFVFVFCGGCGTLVNFCFSLLFSRRADPTLAFAGGYAVSLFVTYALNSFLIFKQKLSAARLMKFVISYIPNFLILFSFVAVLLNVFHLWKVIVYASAAVFGLPITFVIVKRFAFKK